MTAVEHVEIVHASPTSNAQQMWQPVVGPETVRLLQAALTDDDARSSIRKQSVDVLSRCNPPVTSDEGPRTGLVVGYVQSGKTMSFTTVISLARDNGFPLVILFAGTKDNLHQQTAGRLSHDLAVQRPGGLSPWLLVSNPKAGSGDAQSIGQHLKAALDPKVPEKFRRTVVLTVMKNRTRLESLRSLLTDLGQFGVDIASTPVLVIDDEADQAGLNTMASDDDVSATYAAIVGVRRALPQHSYVMYTATPQAPLLINLADALAPDFVVVLQPGDGYTGGIYFFEEHRDEFLELITASEAAKALSPASTEPPASLKRALATYLVGVALRGGGPTSMLVHPSHTQDLHGRYASWVTNLCSAWADVLNEPGPDRDALIKEELKPAYESLRGDDATSAGLHEVLTELPFWIGATHIKVINSGTPEESDIEWDVAPSWILIGGNKLDRGFTVEGLTVTYMPRGTGVGNADSIQQRARFFGYKRSYADLCRAWLVSTTERAFSRYVEHEKVLRKELQQVARDGINLKQWTRRMLLDPALKPCRKSVIDLPFVHGRIKGDGWTNFIKLRIAPSAISANSLALAAFLAAHAGGAVADERDPRTVDRNTVFSVPLAVVLDQMLADWQLQMEDRATVNQLNLLLGTRLDDDPDLQVDVYRMRGGRARGRTLQADGVTVVNLFEGRRPKGSPEGGYPGDNKFFTDGRLSLQIYSVDIMESGARLAEAVPALAVWVPKELAGGVLVGLEQDD